MNKQRIFVTCEEFEEIKDKALLLDVRSAAEYANLKRIEGSQNIYIYDLLKDVESYLPDKNKIIITLCNGGNRSGEVAEKLRWNGYENAYVLSGGIYGYEKYLNKKAIK